MRDSDTGLDWKIGMAASVGLCALTIGMGLLADGVCKILGLYGPGLF